MAVTIRSLVGLACESLGTTRPAHNPNHTDSLGDRTFVDTHEDASADLPWERTETAAQQFDPWASLREQADHANIAYKNIDSALSDRVNQDGPSQRIELLMPAGRSKRSVIVTPQNIGVVLQAEFVEVAFVPGLAATYNRQTGIIEATFRSLGQTTDNAYFLASLVSTHGINLAEARPGALFDVEYEDSHTTRRSRDPQDYVLSISNRSGTRVEIFAGVTLAAISERRSRPAWTMRLFHRQGAALDNVSEFIHEFASALFFEISLKYRIQLGLTPHSSEPRRRAFATTQQLIAAEPPTIPTQRYPQEAASLYMYGASARGMPLLQYLSYYQVLEYFFPLHSKAHLVARFRMALKDPRFSPNSDADISKLVQLLPSGGRYTEPEQLKATLGACVDPDALREFIATNPEGLVGVESFKGIHSINLQNQKESIVDQVATRVYEIRCRIVHTKDGRGPGDAEMFLPFGAESKKLDNDIMLVQYLAEKVITYQANDANW